MSTIQMPWREELTLRCPGCGEQVVGPAKVLKPAEGCLFAEHKERIWHAACAVDDQENDRGAADA